MQAVEHLRFYKTGNKRGVLDVLRLLDFTTCNLKEDLLVLAVTMSDWNANMVFHDLVRGSLRAHPMQPKLTTEQILYAVYLVKDPATDECVLYDVPVLQWNAEVNKPVHRVAPVSKDQIKAIINKVTQSYGLALKQPGGTIDYMMGHVMTETWASLGAKLSNEQIAIATIMAESIDDNPRQTWEIGSGFGKTILIQTFIMRMLATESNLVIRVVNPVKHLSDRDKSIFEPLWTSMQRRVEFGQYLRAPRQDEQLLSILDEGDVSIFDHARKTFSEIQQQQRFLILTGSLGSSCKNILDLVLEKNAIKTMRYKHDTVQCDFDRTILTDDLVPQIKQECQSRPVLVYGKINNDQVQEMGYVYKFQPDKQE